LIADGLASLKAACIQGNRR